MMTDHPLPSWRNGPARTAILDFVARVTAENGPDHVPQPERIAVFDNDGTLWCEQPYQVQVFFLTDRVRELAAKDPALAARQPFKAFLEGDHATLHALGKQGIQELFFATHAGMTEDEFAVLARDWLARAKHPKLGRTFPQLTYQPQLELLDFLRANGFKIFVASGGGMDLIRAFSEDTYGIPPEQIIGSSMKLRFEAGDAGVSIVKLGELNSFDDREEKVVNIGLHIGRRPIFCFGNSDGDLAMLRYTLAGKGARLGLLLHHDDAEREFAYDRDFPLSPLVEALEKADAYGITVVSMQSAWSTVFPDAAAP